MSEVGGNVNPEDSKDVWADLVTYLRFLNECLEHRREAAVVTTNLPRQLRQLMT